MCYNRVMYTAEQLAEPSALQKQTFLLNLYELYEAGSRYLPNGAVGDISIYAEPSEESMSLCITQDGMSEQGHDFSIFSEFSVDDAGKLVKYIDFDFYDPLLPTDLNVSDDVRGYSDRMARSSNIRSISEAISRQSYTPEMNALASGFMSVNATELAKLISLTESLIDKHVRNQSDKPTTN